MIKSKSTNHERIFTIDHVRFGKGDVLLDITQVCDVIVINEDIEAGFITGSIILVDDFFGNLDTFTYEEYIDIEFNTTNNLYQYYDKPYSKRFRVTKYETVLQQNTGTSRAMKFHFTDNAAVINDEIKLMRTFKNTSMAQFVRQICALLELDEKQLFIEDTLYAANFVAPNISPLDMMNWVKLVSQSDTGSDFYFYQNRSGYHFKSIDTLEQVKPKHTIAYRPIGDMNTFNLIYHHEVPKGYDIQNDLRNGGMGSTIYTHDLITKDYKKATYDLSNLITINKEPRDPAIGQKNDANVQFWPNNHFYSTMSENKNSRTHSALLRSATKSRMNFRTVNVEIPGNVDIEAGDMVMIHIPGLNGQLSAMESGRMLVKKLRHVVTRVSVRTQLELVSDGYLK